MNNIINNIEEVGFVRPDALKEELVKKVIRQSQKRNLENIYPTFVTQYYG